MIRVVIPVSQEDWHRLDTFTDNFIRMGGAPAADIMFCPTASVHSPTIEAARKLESCCRSVIIKPLDRDPQGGWFLAPNQHFMWASYMLDELPLKDRLPWLWLELDTTIVKPGWDMALATKYHMECNNHGFLGRIVPTRKYPNPKNRKESFLDSTDPHMRGVCLYPANFTQVVHDQQKFYKNAPWDIELRHYMKKDWTNTSIIQDLWRTVNFHREEDGRIKCDNDPANTNFGDYSGYVEEGAYLVHGCKDGSLARLVASEPAVATTAVPRGSSFTQPEPPQQAVQAARASAPITPEPFKPMAPVAPYSNGGGADYAAAEDFARALAKSADRKEQGSPAMEKILPLLSQKKYRIGDLSKDSGVPIPLITQLSKNPGSGFRIKGPARWVELTT